MADIPLFDQPGAEAAELRAALKTYSALGFEVFPMSSSKKPPRGISWKSEASSDWEKIERLWTEYPLPNVAIKCGPGSGVFVLDLDVKKGAPGQESLADALALAGLSEAEVDTLTATTPSGGRHYYFAFDPDHPLRTCAPIRGFPGLDIRAEGGYAGAYPSSNSDGRPYTWSIEGGVSALDRELIKPMPVALWDALTSRLSRKGKPRARVPSTRVAAPEDRRGSLSGEEVAQVREALDFMDASDSNVWVGVGLFLAFYTSTDEAWEIFDQWSRTTPEAYDEVENQRRWESFCRDSQGGYTRDWLLTTARRHCGWPDPAFRTAVPEGITHTVPVSESGPPMEEELERAFVAIADAPTDAHGLFYAPMGAGKTYAAIRVLARHGSNAILAMPNHELVEEVARQLRAAGVELVVHRGVGQDCVFKERYEEQDEPSNWKAVACIGCPERSDCPVHELSRRLDRQEQVPLVVTVHASIPSLAPRFPERVIVFDEMPDTVELSTLDPEVLSSASGDFDLEHDLRVGCHNLHSLVVGVQENAFELMRAANDRQRRGFDHEDVMALVAEYLDGVEGQDGQAGQTASIGLLFDQRDAADPEAVRAGGQKLRDLRAAGALSGALIESDFGEVEGTLYLAFSKKRFEWSVASPARIPARCLVLDGTAAFSWREMEGWCGHAPLIFGINVLPTSSDAVPALLYLGKRFNRGYLNNWNELPRTAEFLAVEVRRLARDKFPGRPLEQVLAVIGPKVLSDHLRTNDLLPADCIGHFGRDDTATNRFEGRPMLVTAGDYHEPIGVDGQRARCLGIDVDTHVQDRRCATLLQAGARTRWIRMEGEFLDVHFGSMARPGWIASQVTVELQPDKHREKQDVIADARAAARLIAISGVPVTPGLISALAVELELSLDVKTIRERVIKPLLDETGITQVRVHTSVTGRPGRPANAAIREGSIESASITAQDAAFFAPILSFYRRFEPTFIDAAAMLIDVMEQARKEPEIVAWDPRDEHTEDDYSSDFVNA